MLPDEREEDEDPPQPVDHARNRRQEIDEEADGLPEPARREVREKERDADRQRRREHEGNGGADERAVDGARRAEHLAHRIPRAGREERDAEACQGGPPRDPDLERDGHQQQRNAQSEEGDRTLVDAITDRGAFDAGDEADVVTLLPRRLHRRDIGRHEVVPAWTESSRASRRGTSEDGSGA